VCVTRGNFGTLKMAARRYTAKEVAEIVMNFNGDESDLRDFEVSEGDEDQEVFFQSISKTKQLTLWKTQ